MERSYMDTLIVSLSDMHSGSTRSLFLPRFTQFEYTNYSPTEQQKKIYKHWMKCANWVKEHRQGKKLIIVHNGDAIEGIHHNTREIISLKWDDHVRIHCDLMDDFLRAVDYGEGDELHYVSGTESHVMDKELEIADDLGATYQHEMKMNVNGVEIWYTHHGANPGTGFSKGDPYRSWLKQIYWSMKHDNEVIPDVVISSHYHKPVYATYVYDYTTIHGMILPSWQMKTRYAYRAAPFQKNEIGMSFMDVTKEGFIHVHRPLLLEFK